MVCHSQADKILDLPSKTKLERRLRMDLKNQKLKQAQKNIDDIKETDFVSGVPEGVVAIFIGQDQSTNIITKCAITDEQTLILCAKLTEVQAHLFNSVLRVTPKKSEIKIKKAKGE
jgi:hypothetical protein